MNFNISSINIRVANGQMDRIDVYFSQRDESRINNINGNIALTADEYMNNAGIDKLEPLVREKISALILSENDAEAEEEAEETEQTEQQATAQSTTSQVRSLSQIQGTQQEIAQEPTETTQTTQNNQTKRGPKKK